MRHDLKAAPEARGGFTWIEVLIMTLILLFVLVGSASLMSGNMAQLKMNKTDEIARAAAIGELERLKAMGWAVIGAKPLYPPTSTFFCTDAAGVAIAGCVTGLETIAQETGASGRVYVQNYDVNNNGVIDANETTIRQVTVDVSVYGNVNILAQGPRPLLEWLDSPAYAMGADLGGNWGGGGCGYYAAPPVSPPPPGQGSGTLRSVWRLSTIVSQNGVTP